MFKVTLAWYVELDGVESTKLSITIDMPYIPTKDTIIKIGPASMIVDYIMYFAGDQSTYIRCVSCSFYDKNLYSIFLEKLIDHGYREHE